MKKIKKALVAAGAAGATAFTSYLLTGSLDTQGLEASLVTVAAAAISGGLTWAVKNVEEYRNRR